MEHLYLDSTTYMRYILVSMVLKALTVDHKKLKFQGVPFTVILPTLYL